MNKNQKHQLLPSLRHLALAAGIVMFLLIGIFLVISTAVPECGGAAICIYHPTTIEIEQFGANEPALQEPVAISSNCENPGSTGWTGALCEEGPVPTPTTLPDCTPCDGNPIDLP
jgi:hypothetical protein